MKERQYEKTNGSARSSCPRWWWGLLLLTVFLSAGRSPLWAGEITLLWSKNKEAVEGYKVFSRQEKETYDYTQPIATTLQDACGDENCRATISVSDGTDVYFVVRSYLKSGVESPDSNEAFYHADQPRQPTTFSLTWSPTIDSVVGYRIFRRLPDQGYDYTKPIQSVSTSSCTKDECTATIPIPDQSDYFYVVRAYNSQGVESDNSNEAFFDAEAFFQVAQAAPAESKEGETGVVGIIRDAVNGLADSLTGSLPLQEGPSTGKTVSSIGSSYQEQNAETIHPAIEAFGPQLEHQKWLAILWDEYMQANGEARVSMGDIDGDGKDEVVIGLGPSPDPAIPGGLFQVLDHDYTHLAWGQIRWPEYVLANGESFPACGDLDGDGKEEIVIGLGEGGQGKAEIFTYRDGQIYHQNWFQVDWPEYNQYFGKTHPVCGDLDQDGKDEIVVGLGSDQTNPGIPAGLFQILDNDLSSLAWGEVDWPDYNRSNGETYPTLGDLTGTGKKQIVVGLGNGGEGRVEVFQYQDGAAVHQDWARIDWEAYNQTVGATRPGCGDIDGDGRDEILIGLAPNPDDPGMPGGLFSILDHDYASLAWLEIDWPEYHALNGESFPTAGNMDTDDTDEILVGLGTRTAQAATIRSTTNGSGPMVEGSVGAAAAEQGSGCFINSISN